MKTTNSVPVAAMRCAFSNPRRNLDAAVIQNAVKVVQQHFRQLLEGLQTLPAELIDPSLQIIQHGAFIVVRPQPIQTFFEEVGFKHLPVESKQLVQLLALAWS